MAMADGMAKSRAGEGLLRDALERQDTGMLFRHLGFGDLDGEGEVYVVRCDADCVRHRSFSERREEWEIKEFGCRWFCAGERRGEEGERRRRGAGAAAGHGSVVAGRELREGKSDVRGAN